MMADKLTPDRRSANMSRIRSRDTKIEIRLRQALWANGTRGYRVHPKSIEGKPDIAFIGKRVAVFVDGCFWHGCEKCFVAPSSNVEYWQPKIARNRERDRRVTAALEAEGWLVLRVWEHEIESDIAGSVLRVQNAVSGR